MNKYTIYFQGRKIEITGDFLSDREDYWQITMDSLKGLKTVAIVPKGILITIELIK